MLNGKMTYLGIAQMGAAYLLKDYASQEEVSAAVSNLFNVVSGVVMFVGFAQAVYGRYRIAREKY